MGGPGSGPKEKGAAAKFENAFRSAQTAKPMKSKLQGKSQKAIAASFEKQLRAASKGRKGK